MLRRYRLKYILEAENQTSVFKEISQLYHFAFKLKKGKNWLT